MSKNKGILYFKNPVIDEENGYEIDRIDFNNFDQKKISNETMNCIAMSDKMLSPVSTSGNDKVTVTYTLNYKDALSLYGVVSKNEKEIFRETANIDEETIVEQIYNAIHDKTNKSFSVNRLDIINDNLQTIKNVLYANAFANDLLLTDEEYNYKINVYAPGTKNLIGVANRMSIKLDSIYLMELVVFESNTSLSKIDIEMIIDKGTAITFKDLNLLSENGKSIKYCSFGVSNAKVKKIYATDSLPFDDSRMKMKNILVPNTKMSNLSTKTLSDELIRMNTQDDLLRFYKQNKKMNIITLDINKFLLI